MKQKYYPPVFNQESFHCIYCHVYSQHIWSENAKFPLSFRNPRYFHTKKILISSLCTHCQQSTLWLHDEIIYPIKNAPIHPHEEMPEELQKDFEEAVSIVNKSPRGAAALLRLVLQKLMKEVGEKGESINQDISNLVKKGLHPHIQQALDYCRVVGNNAVHPGEIKLDDSPEIANTLFEMINLIVEELIARPKRATELFSKLPEGARQAIEKRDRSKN